MWEPYYQHDFSELEGVHLSCMGIYSFSCIVLYLVGFFHCFSVCLFVCLIISLPSSSFA